jgi:hypothetical protein
MLSAKKGEKTQGNIAEYSKQYLSSGMFLFPTYFLPPPSLRPANQDLKTWKQGDKKCRPKLHLKCLQL